MDYLAKVHPAYHYVCSCAGDSDDYIPRLIRGHGGCAVLWHHNFHGKVTPLSTPKSEHVVGIKLSAIPNDLIIFSVYLPCRSGCTEKFRQVLDVLDSVFLTYPQARIIFAGDLNADPGRVGGPFGGAPNEQGIILGRYLVRWGYVSAHLHYQPVSSVCTYESEAHGTFSSIDHILCPQFLLDSISKSGVLGDHHLNTSDHFAVWLEISIELALDAEFSDGRRAQRCVFVPNWRRLAGNDHCRLAYAQWLEEHLPVFPGCWDMADIEKYTDDLISSFHSAAKSHIPRRSFQKHIKPSWSPDLKSAHSLSKSKYRAWVSAGRPHDSNNPIKRAYKDLEAKREFRKEFRKYSRNQLDTFYSSLDIANNDCYRLIRNFFGKKVQQVSRLHLNGKWFEGEEMLLAWVEHFSSLASPGMLSAHQLHHSNDVDARVAALYDISLSATECIVVSPEQVKGIIVSLPKGKAVGPDSLYYEHLLYGPIDVICDRLTSLFNAMLSSAYVPNVFCLSYVIPIPKAGSSLDLSSPSNYRGISLSSALSKIFEKVLMISLTEILSPRIHSLQGGFRPGYGSTHTSFLLSEGINYCRENHSKAFVALLDARKAFDTVWHAGLFLKLYEYGVTGKLWLLMYHWYMELQAAVYWNGSISIEFRIRQGVRQGAICSPLLYAVYINDLLVSLEEEQLGLSISGIYIGCPTYADDMALISDDSDQLQLMLDKAYSYAAKWHYSFGAAKSAILVFGESVISRRKFRESREWHIGGEVVSEADSAKHLGILLSVTSSTLNHTVKSVTSARGAFYALTPFGARHGCLHPKTSLRLYYTYVRPILLFGFDLITPTKTELTILERAQLTVLRIILGVPTRTSSVAIHAMVGSLPIKYLLLSKQLMLLHSILSLTTESAQKRLLMARLQSDPDLCVRLNKRSFMTSVQASLEELDLPDIYLLSQQLPSKQAWKCHIKTLLFCQLASEFEAQQACSDSLRHAAHLSHNIIMGKMAPILLSSKGDVSLSRLLNFRIRLILGCSSLNVDTAAFHARPGRIRDPICSLCNQQPENIEHFLLRCPSLQETRCKWLSTVLSSISENDLISYVLGVVGTNNRPLQESLTRFVADLRSARGILLLP
jgi:hypothetical protein